MVTIEPILGSHISDAVVLLVKAAGQHGSARMSFNDIEVIATAGEAQSDVLARWNKKFDDAHIAYLNSPEHAAHQKARDAEIAELQARHDDLVSDLSSLDWSSDVAVLDWICAVQPATDDVGVVKNKDAIINAFASHGFKPNEFAGDAYVAGDRNIEFRYLVGQALATLQARSIHGMILSFADRWRAKYAP